MSNANVFWRIVAEDGPPWGVILPLIVLIGLAIGIGLIDARRAPSDQSTDAPWWAIPLLLTVGIVALFGLISGNLLPQIDWVVTHLETREGQEALLAAVTLCVLSILLIRVERRWWISRQDAAPDAPFLSFIVLPIQVGAIYGLVVLYPWTGIWTGPQYEGMGGLIIIPLQGLLWLVKAVIGAALAAMILKYALPYLVELGWWLPGAILRRPVTVGVLLLWTYGIWCWQAGIISLAAFFP